MKHNFDSITIVFITLFIILSFCNISVETNVNQQNNDNITTEKIISSVSPTSFGIYKELIGIFKDDSKGMKCFLKIFY
jgi:hypothetical protein